MNFLMFGSVCHTTASDIFPFLLEFLILLLDVYKRSKDELLVDVLFPSSHETSCVGNKVMSRVCKGQRLRTSDISII